VSFIRKMRGGCQAHLLEVDTDRRYVVKFSNNPQGRRTLVNEWVGNKIAEYLGIRTPETAIVRCSRAFLESNADIYIEYAHFRERPLPGPHFGSLYPDTPREMAIFDIFPSKLLRDVTNRQDFMGMLAVDKWLGNADARQAIFHAAQDDDAETASTSNTTSQRRYVAEMIDFGQVFNGEHWEFLDAPLLGLYRDPEVYDGIDYDRDVEPWIEKVRQFPAEQIERIAAEIPEIWIGKDRPQFERLLNQLLRRRARIGDLMHDQVRPRILPTVVSYPCAKPASGARKPALSVVRPAAKRSSTCAGSGVA